MTHTPFPRRTPDQDVTLTTWTIVVRGVFAGDIETLPRDVTGIREMIAGVEGPGVELVLTAHTRGFLLRLIDDRTGFDPLDWACLVPDE